MVQKRMHAKKLFIVIEKIIQAVLLSGAFLLPMLVHSAYADPINGIKIHFLWAIAAFLLICLFLLALFVDRINIQRTIFDVPLFFFVLYVVVASIYTSSSHISFWGRSDVFTLSAITLLSLCIVAWIIVQFTLTQRVWFALLWMTLLGSISSLIVFITTPDNFLTASGLVGGTLGTQYSNTAIVAAVLLVLCVGLLGLKKQYALRICAGLGSLLSFYALIILGFSAGWIAASIGLLAILGFAIIRWQKENIAYFLIAFTFFILCFIFAIIESPLSLRRDLPSEITLSPRVSWSIAMESVSGHAGNLFLGSGPGSYSFVFEKYKPINLARELGSIDLDIVSPYSSLLQLIPETGALGIFLFLAIALLLAGTVPLLVANRIQSGAHSRLNLLDTQVDNFRWAFASAFATWIALSVSLGIVSFELYQWWLWWFFAGLLLAGFTILKVERVSKPVTMRLSTQHPYSLVRVFVLFVGLGGVVSTVFFAARHHSAALSYREALSSVLPNQTINHLRRAIALRPAYGTYHQALAQHYLDAAIEQSRTSEPSAEDIVSNLGLAIEVSREATDKAPYDFRSWSLAGDIYLNASGAIDGAAGWAQGSIEQAIERAPNRPQLYWNLGSAYEIDENATKAEFNYKKALEIRPDFAPALISLAGLYEKAKDIDAALIVYRDAPASLQNNPELLFHYGRLFFNRGNPGDLNNAQLAWEAAIEQNPNYSNVLFGLGNLHEKRGNPAAAREYYQKVLDLNPDNSDVLRRLRDL